MTALIIIVILLTFVFLVNHPKCPIMRVSFEHPDFQTGDLILFHSLDSINAMMMGSYYTHIGVVYDDGGQLKLFEAVNPQTEFLINENKNGIVLCDLEQRLRTYRGYVFYKKLKMPASDENIEHFRNFIDFASRKLYYNTEIFRNFLNKVFFDERIHKGVNCGELAYLSLISLGILPKKYFYKNAKHHLRWLADFDTKDMHLYEEMKYLYYDPFTQTKCPDTD